jgi:hypothetical protein
VAYHSKRFIACAMAFALPATLATSAQALDRHAHQHVGARGGGVVVHTGRSYLDPGASAAVGSENHYFSDSTHYGPQGPDFTQNTAGSELLPGRFGPN